ncbi:MAG TPA: Flp pilus assembly protein CpaB [Actinomycetota bacterium]|nr:Flp pilus assembly protein CpaB [Actinomycetota bacterium]
MLFRRKLPRSSFVLLSLAVVAALAAALVMRGYARHLDVVRPDGGPPIDVVSVTDPVSRGSVLTDDVLAVLTMPARFAPAGAVRALDRAAGRIAVADLAAGEVLTELRLAGSRSGPTASLVPAGMRAVQIPVVAAAGVKPGDLVDVIATFGGGGPHTEVTGEALEVLVVDRGGGGASFGGAASAPSGGVALIVLVTPDVAERLAFASAFATLSVAVRGPGDLLPGESFSVPVETAD